MLPQQSNNTIAGGLDVKLHGGNGRITSQSLLRVPRQEFLSCGVPDSQLSWQASVQEPDAQQLGNEKGRGFTNVKFVHQRRQSFQQEPQETHWKLIEQQQHVSQDLDRPRQHNMEQSVRAEFPETSYSALLHGPDTPPFHPEPAWDSLAVKEHHSAAEYLSGALKGATVKSSVSLDGCEGARSPFRTQPFWPKQMRTEQKFPTKDPSNLGDADAKEQARFNPNVRLHVEPPVRHSVDASLSSNTQSFMQSQQCAMSFNVETKDINRSQPHSQEGITEENGSKQKEGLALPPSSGLPIGHMPNGFNPQQYSAWNVMQNDSMSGADGRHMQHAFHTGYNRWDTSAWQEGHPVMEHTPYLPYGSGHMQMGANHGPYNWQTHSAGRMPDAYSHYYPEGYYPCGSNFSGAGETDSAAPLPCETYGHHYPEPQVYLPPANQFVPGFRTPVIGAEGTSNSNRSFGPQDHANQKNHERLVKAGGQVQPPTLQSSGVKGPHLGNSTNTFKKFREENVVTNGNAEKETSFHEKDAELEGPQVKKLRESSEVDVYHFKTCQSSGNFSSQTRAGSSINVPEILGVDGTPSSSRNSSDVQGSSNHSFVRDRQSQALFQGSGFDSGTDEQGRSSEIVTRTLQRSGMPSHLRLKEAMQGENSASLMPGHTLYRNHTRSTSSGYSFENNAGLPQSDFIPGVRFPPGAQQMQEHEINNGLIPGGSHIGEFLSTVVNSSVSSAQDQSSTDLLMRKLGGQAQINSPPGAPIPLKTSTFQQLQMPAVALKSVFSGKVSPGAATQELPESQSAMLKPFNIGEGPGSLNTSSISYQGTNTEQYAYSTPGYSYSSTGDKAEYPISNLHPDVEQQRTLYTVTSAYPSHLRPSVQTPLRQFEHCKAGPLETGAQSRGFSRPALEKFYPPPPFHSHPWHFQRGSGRVANVPLEAETLPEVRASESFEAAMLTSGMKQFAPKLVNHQANAGYMVEGAFLYPAPGGSGAMSRGSVLSESRHVHQLPAFSLEAGSVSMQQPDNTFLYAHATNKFPAKTIDSRTHLSSITIGSRGAAGPTNMLRDNETLKASQPSAYSDSLATGRSLRQENEDQHPASGHYGDIHTQGRESTAFIDGEAGLSGKTLLEQIPQQASKTNLRAPFAMQPKKRRKSVPSLIPWHIVAAQPRGQLPSMSKAELMWATATNRLSDKDGGGVTDLGIFRAGSRLKLTTQLMQQIFSPLPSVLMHGKQPVNLECGVYNLSKSALGEACRLMAGIEREIESAQKITDTKTIASNGQTRMWNMAKEIAMTRLVERFMERIKRLDFELARLDWSMSVQELRGKSHDLERVSIVHRLGKHHGPDFATSLSEKRLQDAINSHGPLIRKAPPQKYVIAVPMPRTLPEGSRCLSL